MSRALLFLLFCGLIAACSEQRGMPGRPEPADAQPAMTKPARTRSDATLAYEHTVRIELAKEVVPVRMRELQEACTADEEHACTLLDVSLETNSDRPSGSIRMRLAPAGVEPMIGMASKDGEVTSRTTHAEDLAEPVADTERQLALLTTHRDRLVERMKNRALPVEQLITVSKELASVQSQIDSLGTQQANLRRRIDTELLSIHLSLPAQAYEASQSPVFDAFRAFWTNLRVATGDVIEFLAYLIPWLLVVVPGIFMLRLFWRWVTRWLARRESRA